MGSALANSKTTIQKSQHWALGESRYLGLVCAGVDVQASATLSIYLLICLLALLAASFDLSSVGTKARTHVSFGPCVYSICLHTHASYILDGDP